MIGTGITLFFTALGLGLAVGFITTMATDMSGKDRSIPPEYMCDADDIFIVTTIT